MSRRVGRDCGWEKEPDPRLAGAGTMAMYIFVLALAMLFVASIVGYLYLRQVRQPWPPPGFPELPKSLWFSTLAIVISSFTIQSALGAANHGNIPALKRGLSATFMLGLGFLGLQIFAWADIYEKVAHSPHVGGTYLKMFYVLTGLHAVHVVGGLGPLAFVTFRALSNRYTRKSLPGVRYSAIYWHFLDAVWCVLFAVVYLL